MEVCFLLNPKVVPYRGGMANVARPCYKVMEDLIIRLFNDNTCISQTSLLQMSLLRPRSYSDHSIDICTFPDFHNFPDQSIRTHTHTLCFSSFVFVWGGGRKSGTMALVCSALSGRVDSPALSSPRLRPRFHF